MCLCSCISQSKIFFDAFGYCFVFQNMPNTIFNSNSSVTAIVCNCNKLQTLLNLSKVCFNSSVLSVFLQKEWLCLSCQTQRALSGQLGDSEQMSQPTYVPAKPEIQATSTSDMAASKTSPIKIELTTEVTAPKTAPTEGVQIISATTAKEEPAKIKNLAPVPSIEKEKERKQLVTMIDVSSVASDKQSFEDSIQEPVVAKPDVSITKTSDMEIVKEVTMFEVVPEKKAKPELPVSGNIITEVQTNDYINLMDTTSSLQEKLQPYLQEQEKAVESGKTKAADSKELDDKMIEKITDISTQVSQPLLTARLVRKVIKYIYLKYFCYLYQED